MIIWYKWYHRNFTEKAANMIVSREGSSKFNTRSSQKHRVARGFLQISQKKLPNGSFRARLLPNFTEEARKSITCCGQGLVVSYCLIICCGQGLVVSYCLIICCGPVTPDTFYTRHLFTPDNFYTRCFFTPNTFYTRHLLHQTPFRPGTFYTSHLLHACYTKHLLHQTPVTPDTLYTGHLLHQAPFTPGTLYTRKLLHQTLFTPNTSYTKHLLHQAPFTPNTFYTEKLPKGSFCAMLPTIFTEKASKTIVSCEASSKFHSTSLQNERFARCFRQFSHKKLPKRSFRARLPRNFTAQASKKIVSCEASSKFHRTSFQNDRFARYFRQFSQKKLPKWSFRARLPPNLTEQASKTSFSCEASSKFHRTILPIQNERFARCFRQFPEKICISPQFRAMDPPNPTRGFIQQKQNVRLATTACHPKFQNVRFTTAARAKMYESSAGSPGQPAAYKNQHFTTVSDVWLARSDERVAPSKSKFAFHHSFGRPMSTKRREGCERTQADSHFTTVLDVRRSTKWREGCDGDLQNSHFTTVLDVRRARSDERVATAIYKIRISPQFWTSDEHEVTRGLRGPCSKFAFHHSFGRPTSTKWREGGLPSWSTKPTLRKKKKEILRKSWSTAILSRSSQQIFSADFLSRSSQQIFSADLLSRFSQQIFSADLLSRSSQQQIFSADFLSRSSQQIFFTADLLSRSSQQIVSADLLSRFSQQIFSAIMLLWSGVGGQLLFDHLLWSGVGGQLLSHHLLWLGVGGQLLSDQLLSYHLLWSGVGGQLLSYHVGGQYCTSSLEGPFRGAFGKKSTAEPSSTILNSSISMVFLCVQLFGTQLLEGNRYNHCEKDRVSPMWAQSFQVTEALKCHGNFNLGPSPPDLATSAVPNYFRNSFLKSKHKNHSCTML